MFLLLAGSAAAAPAIDTSQPVQGETITVTQGDDWDAGTPITDAWEDCTTAGVCAPVASGATGASYTVAASDVGSELEVLETGTINGASAAESSSPTAPVVGVPANTSPPTLSSYTPQVGTALSASPGSWTSDPTQTFFYQWARCAAGTCTPIPGAGSSTYVPGTADVGSALEVDVTPIPVLVTAVPSAPTDAVKAAPVNAPSPPTNKSAPTVAGVASLGQTLTAGTGSWSNAPTGYTYQWLRCAVSCVAIPGAVAATYQPVDADVGQSLAVEVTAANSGGSSAAKTSARTATVTAGSTVQIAASPARPLVNQGVDLVGVITSSAVGTTPAGTVTFSANGAAIAACTGLPVSGSGETASASCTASFPVSSPSLTASFTPAASSPLLASTSATTSVAVQQDGSTTALDASSEVTRGSATTFTASVTGAQNLTGPVLPSGTVSFSDHGKTIRGCGAVAITDGGATCTVRYAQTGSHSVSARYGGDVDFQGSASRAKTVRVLAAPESHSRLKPKILGRVTATMQWTFHYTPSFTRILALVIHGAAIGSKVTVRCAGRGCPFKSRVTQVDTPRRCAARRGHACPPPGTLDLEPGFRRHDLRIHARVVIMISRRRYVGKYYRFLVRARTQPAVRITCLAPGSSTPGKGCTSA